MEARPLVTDMPVKERLYDIDDLWRIVSQSDITEESYELIDGEIIVSPRPSWEHATLAAELARLIGNYVVPRGLGTVGVESGHHPIDDRSNLLGPDVVFVRRGRVAKRHFRKWVPLMPDLAIEIKSPSNRMTDLRDKAVKYLSLGSQLVWLILPDSQSAEVWRLDENGDARSELVSSGGALFGGDVLPGFELPLNALFR